MAELRSHGIVREPERFEQPPAGPWVYEQQQLGFNYRITDLQAALGRSQLQRLEAIVEERNRILHTYRELLADLPLRLLDVPDDVLSAVHLAVIRLERSSPERHQQVFEGLRASGIGVQLHYSPVHLQPYYRRLGFADGQYPQSETYATSTISLPLFPSLTLADQKRVVSLLKVLLNSGGP
jgi:dTDP-4-amino-4,6-dideoxygalactose transaminase